MRALRTTIVGSLVLFGLALALDALRTTATADDNDKKAMRVFLKKVVVSETNKDGKSWDINDGKPDIVVRIKNVSDDTIKEFTSAEKTDTFEATYDVATILVSAGQSLRFVVEDKDVAANDTIGDTTLKITSEMLKKGRVTLEFGLVKHLSLEFKAK